MASTLQDLSDHPLKTDSLVGEHSVTQYLKLPQPTDSDDDVVLCSKDPFVVIFFNNDMCEFSVTDLDGKDEITPSTKGISWIDDTIFSEFVKDGGRKTISLEDYNRANKGKKKGDVHAYAAEKEGNKYYLRLTKVCSDENETPLVDIRTLPIFQEYLSDISFPFLNDESLKNIRSLVEDIVDKMSDLENKDTCFLEGRDVFTNAISLTILGRDTTKKPFNFWKPYQQEDTSIHNFTRQELDNHESCYLRTNLPKDRNFIMPQDENETDIFMRDLKRLKEKMDKEAPLNMVAIQSAEDEKTDVPNIKYFTKKKVVEETNDMDTEEADADYND